MFRIELERSLVGETLSPIDYEMLEVELRRCVQAITNITTIGAFKPLSLS